MSKITTWVLTEFDLSEIEMTPQEIVEYLTLQENAGFDKEFIERYFNDKAWNGDLEAIKEIRENLSEETKSFIRQFIEETEEEE